MKNLICIALTITLILLNGLTHSLLSKDIKEDSLIQKKTKPGRKKSEVYFPVQPKHILISGLEISSEMTTLTIGVEVPISKLTSVIANLGYGISGEYEYIDAAPALSNSQTNFLLNTEMKFYFKELNSKSNWFFTSGFYYSHSGYEGIHTVEKNFRYQPPGYFLFFPIPGHWYAQDYHQNEFQIETTNIGLSMNLGFQIVFGKRCPLEIKTGILFRHQNVSVSNYESSDPNPNDGYAKQELEPDPSVVMPLISFKIGYMIFKK